MHLCRPFSISPVCGGPVKYQHVFIRPHQVAPLLSLQLLWICSFLLAPALNFRHFFFLWLARVQPASNNPGISTTVCQSKAVPVTVLSRDGHYRQRFAAGRSPLALPDKQQVAVKRNILTSTFIPHPLLSQQAFSRFVQDYLMFGNAYLEKRTNRLGGILSLEPLLAKYTRRGIDLDTYWFVQYGMTTQPYEFTKGSIFHLMKPDLNQEIYGLPEHLSAIPSALLNEPTMVFRLKYYINGSHAGFIMYMTDAVLNQEDVNNIRQAMKSAKGPGNFRNLFMCSPNGKKDGIQIIPLSEVAAKDEFLNIKNVSRDDMMAAHRVPPQMMGIMPSNVGRVWECGEGQSCFCAE